jgi:hypothetical protein
MKTTTNTCSHCGAPVTMIQGFGEMVANFHGQKGGSKGRGIAGRCPGSRKPAAEVGAERLAAYEAATVARVASFSAPVAKVAAPAAKAETFAGDWWLPRNARRF